MPGSLQEAFSEALALFDGGRVEAAAAAFEALRDEHGQHPHVVLNLGHAYGALGRSADAADCYRSLLQVENRGLVYAAYWSLADLKDYRFSDPEIEHMQDLVEEVASHPQRCLLLFALGHGLERLGDHEGAFAAFTRANEQVAAERPFPGEAWRQLEAKLESIATLPRSMKPATGPQPIFIVGMPRSGSTLLEQILAAHSRVCACGELPFIENLARSLDRQGGYANALPRLSTDQCEQAAAAYLQQAAPHIEGEREFFVDKWPDNFWYVGLIRALFPAAPIINIIRDPLDNALAVFKQYFSHGNAHASRLDWAAAYWDVYLDVMALWERLLPGDVLHLRYARLVQSPDESIRSLLAHCGLDFEEQVLRFHEGKGAVMTPSGQQVRRPIYASAVGSAGPYREFVREFLPRFESLARRTEKL